VIDQIERQGTGWHADALAGAYWLIAPAPGAQAAIAFTGALAPEALAAHALLAEDLPGLGLLNVTSPDLLHRDWSAAQAARWTEGTRHTGHAARLLGELAADAALVTLIDGSPSALSWLGSVRGQRLAALGTDRFGQTGDLTDLYRTYRLDAEAVVDAMAELLLDRG
jgi:pyruvate dehydrogenase E1 component